MTYFENKMPRLFSYTIPVDDGAAPNPFHGICTLAICKPAIRRVAKKGDWVAGLGSVNAPKGDLSGKLVYAMRVEEVITLQEYDSQADRRWPAKIPNLESLDLADHLGDCIYDYSAGNIPEQRAGVHNSLNQSTDLGGENVLISKHFYYFGARAIDLPPKLQPIVHQTQSHKSNANKLLFTKFVEWIEKLGLAPGQYGWPDHYRSPQSLIGGRGCGDRCGTIDQYSSCG